jgi:hypothetical protein
MIREVAATLDPTTGRSAARQDDFDAILSRLEGDGDAAHEHMANLMGSFRPGLFAGGDDLAAVQDNLDLERWFRVAKGHERRIHGHRHAGVRVVQGVRPKNDVDTTAVLAVASSLYPGAGTLNATIIARTPTSFTLQVEIAYNGSMLDFEEALQQRLNEAGVVATAEGLKQFDTDGSPITVGPVKFTSKGQVEKDYQTPYGVATLARHVYQGPQGGLTYCPLDRDARIVVSSTPRFAKTISHKYAESSSPRVQVDLEENHGRVVSPGLAHLIPGISAQYSQ